MDSNNCNSCQATPEQCEYSLRQHSKPCCNKCYRTDTHDMSVADWINLRKSMEHSNRDNIYKIYIKSLERMDGITLYGSSIIDAMKRAKGIYLSSILEFKVYKRPDEWQEIDLTNL